MAGPDDAQKGDRPMKKWFCLSAALALFAFPGSSYCEEKREQEEPAVTLQEVVVTGTRVEERVERIPASISVIEEEDIKNSNAKNVAELLRSQEGIVVRDLLGNGKTAQVDLRGFGETGPYNNLVLVDGRRVNEIDLSGVDWTQIPLEQVERVEIVRGTGTVLYGDNAVGGVINIITKAPSEGLSVSAGGLAGSYSRHQERFSISGGGPNYGASLFGSYESTDGYRENNNFRAKNIGGNITFDPNQHLSLKLSGSYHADDYGLPGPLTQEELKTDRRGTAYPLDEAETEDGYLNLGSDLRLGKFGDLVVDLSYRDRQSETQWVSYLWAEDRQTETWGVTPRYVLDSEMLGRANKLILGVDFYSAEQDVKSFLGSLSTLSDLASVDRDSYGIYLHDDFSLSQDLILSLGARREKVEYDLSKTDLGPFPLAPLDASLTERENAYVAGITWLYRDQSSLFARANRSFRFPLVDELVVSDFLAGEIRVNDTLKPQTGDHYEAGVRHFFTPNVEGNATFFWAEIKNEIFYNTLTFSNENHPETLHRGLEIGARATVFGKLTLYGNFTYEKATFEKEPFKDKNIPAVPRHKANLGLKVFDVLPGLVFTAQYNYVGSSYLISDQANQFEKIEDYYTVDARLTYAWRRLNAYFGVNNLTDQDFSTYGVVYGFPAQAYFYPAPERNWVAGIEFTF
jgi:iron complex outermembrane receptor protein